MILRAEQLDPDAWAMPFRRDMLPRREASIERAREEIDNG